MIGIIGSGNIGQSIARMLLNNNKKVVCSVRSQNRLDELKVTLYDNNIKFKKLNWEVTKLSSAIILSVKPNIVRKVCYEISPFITPNKPIISVAAAVPLDKLHEWLPKNSTIIRAMPNVLPATSNVVPYISNSNVEDILEYIFEDNILMRLEQDEEIDAATLISGCGPAFLSWFSEIIGRVGDGVLSDEVIKELVCNTMIGTGMKLISTDSEEIIRTVASKGGATEAALNQMNEMGLDKDIEDAINMAHDKINTLVKEL